jgi:hypothetical protein
MKMTFSRLKPGMKPAILIGLIFAVLVPQIASGQVSFKRDFKDKLMFEMSAGKSISHSINVVNDSTGPLDVSLSATDGVITSTGAFTTTSRYEKQDYVGTWITFPEPALHLDAKEEKKVTFIIRVADDATPGEYAGGLSVEPASLTTTLKETGAITSTRVVVPVYIKVKGIKVTDYALDSFTHQDENGHSFTFALSNNGNTLLKAQGEIEIRSITGKTYSVPIGDINLLKNSKQVSTTNWDQKPFWGIFTATAKIKMLELDLGTNSYVEIGQLEKTVDFSVIPWTILVLALVLLILIAPIVVIRKMRRKSFLGKCVPYQVVEGETLMSIARKNRLDWRKLAKINNLKAPYELSKGQKIMLLPKK